MNKAIQRTLDYFKRLQIRSQHNTVPIDKEICLLTNKTNSCSLFYPYPSKMDFDRTQMLISHYGVFSHLKNKYSHHSFFVEKGDTVVDVGSFVGGYAISSIMQGASRAIAFEPSPTNARCLRLNSLIHSADITVKQAAVSNENSVGAMNLSSTGADNSLLTPDEGNLGVSIEVKLVRLESALQDFNVNESNTLLKVEAEGSEIEVLEGLGALRPKKVVVDVSPERDGVEPREQIAKILTEKGYKIVGHTKQCLFAKI